MNQTLVGFRESVGKFLPATPPKDEKLSKCVQQIFEKKEELVTQNLANKKRRFHPLTGSCSVQVLHDALNTVFVACVAIKAFVPSITHIAAVGITFSVFGGIGGVMNILVGGVCLREALQAFKNGDRAKGSRYLIMSCALFAIGAFMILSTISAYVGVLGGVGAVIAANPWILPVLVLILMLPLMYEVLNDNKRIFSHTDGYSTLKLDELKKILEKEDVPWDEILALWNGSLLDYKQIKEEFNSKKIEKISGRIDDLQSNIGAKGAVAAFKLFQSVLDQNREDVQKHIKELKGHATHWKRVQYIRLFQQVLYVGSFILSIIALRSVNTRIIELVDNISMFLGMGIPLYLDALCPLTRNCPIVVPKVDVKELNKKTA